MDTVRPYITKDEPFGPIDSTDIDSNDIDALRLLFEQQNRIYKNLRNRPSIIIGRRGSGKTYYLRSVFFDKAYKHYTEIRTARVLGHMAKVVQKATKDAFFPEMVSELWEMILWVGVFAEVRKHSLLSSDDLYVVNAYLEKLDVRGTDDIDGLFIDLTNMLDNAMDKNPSRGAADILRGLDRFSFDYAKSIVLSSFERSNTSFVILMDSLDDFQLDIDSVAHSLQGLLKLVGSMNKPRDLLYHAQRGATPLPALPV